MYNQKNLYFKSPQLFSSMTHHHPNIRQLIKSQIQPSPILTAWTSMKLCLVKKKFKLNFPLSTMGK